MSIIKEIYSKPIVLGIGILLLFSILLTISIGSNYFQVVASSNVTNSTTLTDKNNNMSLPNPLEMNSFDLISNNSDSKDNNTLVSIIPLNQDQRQIHVDSIILQNLASNKTLDNISSFVHDGGAVCNTLDGTSSDFLGINEQTPCTVTLSNNDKEISIDFDYEIIENDDTNDITEYYNNEQQPSNVVLEPGEIFVFSREGGIDYDDLGIYLVDSNVENGNIIRIDSNEFARIFLDHFQFLNTDFFIVPNTDDGFSTWKLVIEYEVNPELESYYIAENVSIEE
ncbi:MAG: hypothetical protein L0H53_09930 [Candidatus Nitrosocosmicus sp.]|nr:hypothetical protein [Candidatus Nitrosocosmicus sp.]MDN5867986.1 hypothetical protein [Candidatus Nitrosocosmicus sp.]